jgi:polysaccharide chain length determinant protein (PEP-CTERM system associated)
MHENFRIAVVALRGMWAHRRLGLATAWVTGATALATIMVLPDKYEASARIFANTDSILKPLMTGLTVQPNEDLRIVMLSRLLISRPNVERLVQTVGLDAQAKSGEDRERIVDSVMKTLEIKGAGRDNLNRDNLYTLTFRDVEPGRAKQAVNVLASMFIESSKGGKVEDTNAAKKFIDEQIVVYEKKLQEAENRLKDFKIRHFGLTPGEGKDFFVRMSETNALLSQARLELREAERARDAFRRGLASEESAVDSSAGASAGPGGMLAEIDARIDSMRRNLDTMLQKYTDRHPDVLGAQRVIRELEEQRRQLIAANRKSGVSVIQPATSGQRASETLKVSLAQAEAAVASLSSRVAEYAERYNRLKASATLVPQLDAEYAQLNRDYDVNKKNYESLVARRESATISGEMQSVAGVSDFRLVDPPRVSPSPVWPNRRLLIPLALMLALAAGLGAAYIAHETRPTFYDGRSLREVSGLPLLGVVSMIMSEPKRLAERRSMFRFLGGVGALLGTYLASLIVLEMLTARLL